MKVQPRTLSGFMELLPEKRMPFMGSRRLIRPLLKQARSCSLRLVAKQKNKFIGSLRAILI